MPIIHSLRDQTQPLCDPWFTALLRPDPLGKNLCSTSFGQQNICPLFAVLHVHCLIGGRSRMKRLWENRCWPHDAIIHGPNQVKCMPLTPSPAAIPWSGRASDGRVSGGRLKALVVRCSSSLWEFLEPAVGGSFIYIYIPKKKRARTPAGDKNIVYL